MAGQMMNPYQASDLTAALQYRAYSKSPEAKANASERIQLSSEELSKSAIKATEFMNSNAERTEKLKRSKRMSPKQARKSNKLAERIAEAQARFLEQTLRILED